MMVVGTRDESEGAALALGIYLGVLGTMDLCDTSNGGF